jgi:hypothetical protein
MEEGAMDWSAHLPFVLVGLCLLLGAGLLLRQQQVWRRRTDSWARAAGMLGLAPLVPLELPSWASGLSFFKRGRRPKVRAGVAGRTWGVDAVLADYQYTTGGGNSQSTHRQTVCVLRDGGLDLPHFLLRPEHGMFDRIGEMFGAKDFDFNEDSAFSQAFVLKGEDEAAVRTLFDPTVRAQLVQAAGTRLFLEGKGETLLLHRGRLLDTERAGELLQQAVQLAPLLRKR